MSQATKPAAFMFFGAYASISVPPWNLKVIRPSAWTVAMSIMVSQSFSSTKDHRNSIRITVVFCWSRGELNSPKIIFSRWFWNIWTVSVRNGESRIHAVDGETACQRAVKWRFFRFGYKLATWSQSLGGLQPRFFETREAGIKRLEKYLFAVLIIAYRREFVKFGWFCELLTSRSYRRLLRAK